MSTQTSGLTKPSTAASLGHKFLISHGQRASDAQPTRIECLWPDFVGWLYQHQRIQASLTPAEYAALKQFPSKSPEGQRIHDDKDGPYIVLADFGGNRREYASLLHSSGVPLDFDAGWVTAEVIQATLASVGLAYVAFTTYAHQPGAERWRVFVPSARPMTADQHTASWFYLSGLFNNAADPAAKDATRLSYLPGRCLLPDAARIFHVDGDLFVPVLAAPPAPAMVQPAASGPVAGWDGPLDDERLLDTACNTRTRPDERFGGPIHFAMLWDANPEWLATRFPGQNGQPWDYTQADMALAGELAYWTGSDAERMAALMRQSGLAAVRGGDTDWSERKVPMAVDRAVSNAKRWHFMKPVVPAGTTEPPLAAGVPVGGVLTSDPYLTAKGFLVAEVLPSLKCWQDEFYRYRNGIYVPVSKAAVRAKLYPYIAAGGQTPTKDNVSNIVDALKAAAHLDDNMQPPAWLDDPARKIPGLIICRNGAFDLDTSAQYPLTPNLFSFNALPVEYDPAASAPEWQKFLDSVWRHDPESIQALQEICGLLLTPLTVFQKMFLLCGPRRSGKGTILRVMRALLGGNDNVVSPTLGSLAGQFGLQPLIGKLAAFVGDVRLSGKADQATLVERLLSITGEDNISIPRKHTTDFDAKLNVRFVFSSNEIPRLADASGAAASRFIVLVMTESFFGREDLGLEARLMGELPGILAWCVKGRRRLIERGRFIQPESAREQIQQLEDLGSPLAVFLRETCTVAAGCQVPCDALFKAWVSWCGQNQRMPGNAQVFGRDLRAFMPGLKVRQHRAQDGRERVYEGIALTQAASPALYVGFGMAPVPAAVAGPAPAPPAPIAPPAP